MFCHRHEIIAVVMGVFCVGCDQIPKDGRTTNDVIIGSVDLLWSCKTSNELERYYAEQSLGERVHIQAAGQLIFAQSFPYSGVRSSHLYVYERGTDGVSFVCFLRVPTQDNVGVRLEKDGSVEVRYGDESMMVPNHLL